MWEGVAHACVNHPSQGLLLCVPSRRLSRGSAQSRGGPEPSPRPPQAEPGPAAPGGGEDAPAETAPCLSIALLRPHTEVTRTRGAGGKRRQKDSGGEGEVAVNPLHRPGMLCPAAGLA